MASFLLEAYVAVAGVSLPTGPNSFVDDEGNPAEAAINALAAAGVVVGKAPGVYDPDATITREQIATFFVNLLEQLAADGYL